VDTEIGLRVAKTAATHNSRADWMFSSCVCYGHSLCHRCQNVYREVGVWAAGVAVLQGLQTGEFPACVTPGSWVDG